MQLFLVGGSNSGSAQDLNLQQRLEQISPPPQPIAPDFNVGRSQRPSRPEAKHPGHAVHHKHKQQKARENK